jgi:glycosyltransferase involved in cell wall biosynthesis
VALRVKYFLNHLRHSGWIIDVITAAPNATSYDLITVHHVPNYTPDRFFSFFDRIRLTKVLHWFIWPDWFVFWIFPAYLKARRLFTHNEYDGILVFMMPYSQGLVGVWLKQEFDVPLILNLNDSPTCSDMNPTFPSRYHYAFTQKLEDFYIQNSDAVVYVSQRNMKRVADRQPMALRNKLHLIRRGAQALVTRSGKNKNDAFHIVYTGATGGWYDFLEERASPSLPKRIYRAWQRWGQYVTTELDYRTHGPIFVGQAVKQVIEHHPDWAGRIHIDVYGSKYPNDVVDAVLERFDLHGIVHLHGRVPHNEALQHMIEADLLFMALPDRVDGSPGGRISAKTYEYLMTDRPILAALPPGENRDYLQDKPGVYLTQPAGVDEMAGTIAEQVARTFGGSPASVDRSQLHPELLANSRALAFKHILNNLICG